MRLLDQHKSPLNAALLGDGVDEQIVDLDPGTLHYWVFAEN